MDSGTSPQADRIAVLLFAAVAAGLSAPCILRFPATSLCEALSARLKNPIRGAPIRVDRVVVVDVAARVDIPRIVGVAAIS